MSPFRNLVYNRLLSDLSSCSLLGDPFLFSYVPLESLNLHHFEHALLIVHEFLLQLLVLNELTIPHCRDSANIDPFVHFLDLVQLLIKQLL